MSDASGDHDESFDALHGNTLHGRVADWSPPGGQPRLNSPIAYRCPKCQAELGQKCRRWVSGRVCGKETGGGYWRPMKSFHTERRNQS